MLKKSKKGSMKDYLSYLASDKKDFSLIADKKFEFVLIKENFSPTISNAYGNPLKKVGSHRIETFGSIVEKDPKTKEMKARLIRYLPTEPSIYKDEQSDDRDHPKKKYSVEFTRGRRVVDANIEPQLLEFLMKCNLNDSNPNKRKGVLPLFQLKDNSVMIDEQEKDDDLKYDAIEFARHGDSDEVEALALVLNIDLNQSLKEIRYDMRRLAENDFKSFMRIKKDPITAKKYFIKKAINEEILIIDASNNSISWKTNPYNPLHVAAINVDIVESFAKVLSTEAGQVIFDALVEIIQPVEAPPETVTASLYVPSQEEKMQMINSKTVHTPAPSLEIQDIPSDVELVNIFDEAIKLNVLFKSSPAWYEYNAGVTKEKFNNKEQFVKKMKTIAGLWKSFKYSLEKAREMALTETSQE